MTSGVCREHTVKEPRWLGRGPSLTVYGDHVQLQPPPIKELRPVARPNGLGTSGWRNAVGVVLRGVAPDVDLVTGLIIGHVGQPPSVRRYRWTTLVGICGDETGALGIVSRPEPDVACTNRVGFVEEQCAPIRRPGPWRAGVAEDHRFRPVFTRDVQAVDPLWPVAIRGERNPSSVP